MCFGHCTGLVKMDLSNAYQIVLVHPDNQPLLGIAWQGNHFLDRALPFGFRSAPKLFNAVADLLAWSLHCEGILLLIHYLDDFSFFGPPGSGITATTHSVVEGLFDCWGVPIAHHKTEGLTTTLTFLGIQINTQLFQLSLPAKKITRLQDLLGEWRGKKCCTRRELELLIRYLSHAAVVVYPGRMFLRNFCSLLSKVSKPNHLVRLNFDTRADLAWCQCLLCHWNSVSFFSCPCPIHPHTFNAPGSFGCGAYYPYLNSWCQLPWPLAWSNTGITTKELVPVIAMAALWGIQWVGSHVCFHSDNEAVVLIIQRRRAKHIVLNQLLCCLFFMCQYIASSSSHSWC